MLWHGQQPIGICVFGAPAASLTLRTRYFQLVNPRCPIGLAAINQQLWLLQRVVLHPTYRGAGLAAQFVRRACKLCPVDWIETLSAMGQANPFFERAGFVKVGLVQHRVSKPARQGPYTRPRPARATRAHQHSQPVYYVFDNRQRNCPSGGIPPQRGD
jgi:GNAT superfamily N-acetyltransferase